MKINRKSIIVLISLLLVSIVLISSCGKKAAFTPGTYTAEVPIMGEEVCILNVTFSENAIEKIEAEKTNAGDKPDEVFNTYPDIILKTQNVSKIDAIAEATLSVNAFKEAMLNCIEQAGGDPSKF